MQWALDKTRPICPQLCEQVCVRVAKGEFQPDTRLLSVREVAVAAGVNPNTVQRAFEQLERDGILYSVRGSGWYVSADTDKAKEILSALTKEKTAAYFAAMEALGFDVNAVKEVVKEWEK